MGTIGGKVGFGSGLVAGLLAIGPMMKLVFGECFFEQGCGESETAGLAIVALGSVVVAIAVGLLIREVTNRVLRANG